MTFFFDRSVGKTLPESLRMLRIPLGIEYHQLHFAPDLQDDIWLPIVGIREWFVIGHDYSYHTFESGARALRDYNIGCFCLWGSQATRWEKIRLFARTYDKIVAAAETTQRPFIYRVNRDSSLKLLGFP